MNFTAGRIPADDTRRKLKSSFRLLAFFRRLLLSFIRCINVAIFVCLLVSPAMRFLRFLPCVFLFYFISRFPRQQQAPFAGLACPSVFLLL